MNKFTRYLTLTTILCLTVTVNAADDIVYQGIWGDWQTPVYADQNFYLCGGQMRFQRDQGGGDDTAGNGMNFIFCNKYDWNSKIQRKFDGIWGDWQPKVYCPYNYFVNGMQIRYQNDQGGGDDTALNGVKFSCKNLNGDQSQIVIYEGLWGDWHPWNKFDDYKNQYVVGYKVRFEPDQGRHDDTALNGIVLIGKQFLVKDLNFTYTLPRNFQAMPNVLDVKVINNTASVPVKKTIQFHKQKAITQKWQNSNRFLLGIQMKVGLGIEVPSIGQFSSQLTVTQQYENTFTFGKDITTTQIFQQSFQMQCPSCHICTIKLMVKESTQNIPYTVDILYENGDLVHKTGIYRGMLVSESYDQSSDVVNPACKKNYHHHLHRNLEFVD